MRAACCPADEKLASGSWLAAEYAAAPAEVRGGDSSFEDDNYFPSVPGLEFIADVALAQAASIVADSPTCRKSAGAPMTVERFVRNLVGAPINNPMRIDHDPQDAYVDGVSSHIPPAVPVVRRPCRRGLPIPPAAVLAMSLCSVECRGGFHRHRFGDEPLDCLNARPTQSGQILSTSTPLTRHRGTFPLFTMARTAATATHRDRDRWAITIGSTGDQLVPAKLFDNGSRCP